MQTLTLDAASGLSYLKRPAEGPAIARLMLLHGVGGNEGNLVPLAAHIDPRIEICFIRGPVDLSRDQYAWFHVRFGAQGPVIDPLQAEDSRQRLIRFVRARAALSSKQDDIAHAPTLMAGFSQGGILSASVGLSAPDIVPRFAILCGRILPEIAPHIAPRTQLQRSRALVLHGDLDDKLPVAYAEQSDALLSDLGVPHALHRHPVGHTLNDAMVTQFAHWTNAQAGPVASD